jgi:hypothetical protein
VARGWESKSVEDQVAAAESEKAQRSKPEMDADERDRKSLREGLLLTRARIRQDLDAASNPRHREMLEQALRHLDMEIGATDRPSR